MSADYVYVGLDVGSTTVKAIALDGQTGEILKVVYRRHAARQIACACDVLEDLAKDLPDGAQVHVAVTGSGGSPVALALDLPYVQEVVASARAAVEWYPETQCAIELGGQDAKMIFFSHDDQTGAAHIADMRMNGSCAGGTGAFLDEIATLLVVPIEELDSLAAEGSVVYPISGRCGVFAKTDIKPLINQGVSKADIALSAFHAVAKQVIGGLAQGIDIQAPLLFGGGPLTFMPTLRRVFRERLHLGENDTLLPDHAETLVASGAALVAAQDALTEGSFCVGRAVEDLRESSALTAKPREQGVPLFESEADYHAFMQRHQLAEFAYPHMNRNGAINTYIGIDAGSTTTKVVLMGEDGIPFDALYSANEAEPLEVAVRSLKELRDRYAKRGMPIHVLGIGATGYGEHMFNAAFKCDVHVVETVAHAKAAQTVEPDVSFVLDIGGQDMKAIWMDQGIITDILMNEACSSGCGSFLENFATSLGVPVEGIAELAFSSESPAVLGSRCTVFMNSSVVTAQRNGKSPADIMAGLCTSIVENVFTKVIRVKNFDELGDHIVVQGGTFLNDAVLRAFERYLGREVHRAPYPGLMGALGVALLARDAMETRRKLAQEAADKEGKSAQPVRSRFIGWKALDAFTFEQTSGVPCYFCSNRCHRNVITFPDGSTFVTGNRCEKGEITTDVSDPITHERLKELESSPKAPVNLFDLREQLLFGSWRHQEVLAPRHQAIGLPRVLNFWDSAPFWRVFFESLGFTVRFSDPSSTELYESGLARVTSDTICFPGKLVHGHVQNLAEAGVDRIFMPILSLVPAEGSAATAISMCAVVKGYPMVVKASDDPQERFGVPFDTPLFHWPTEEDRNHQLCDYMRETFGISPAQTRQAIKQGDAAWQEFRDTLQKAGQAALDKAHQSEEGLAVVLATRPYQNDPLVHHDIPRLFMEEGVSVIPADALPDLDKVDLSASRLDIPNNFHARMLASALVAARDPHLAYAQLVSFGCGHDAYLSDEITRLMHETSNSVPLVLKVDESPVQGPLRVRVRSFVETLRLRRLMDRHMVPRPLADPYQRKYTETDRKDRMTVLVPNTSHAFSRLMAAVFNKQGLNAVSLPIGSDQAISLGKKYVHNDICFPAQVVIGEALEALSSGKYDPDHTAVAMAKYVGDCRLTHYGALLRKALDDAGYEQVPIVTNDPEDDRRLHPGFSFNMLSAMRTAFALPMIDVLEDLLRKIRPYELEPGSAEAAFEEAMDHLISGVSGGIPTMNRGFKRALKTMGEVRYDRSQPRPQVLVVGEYLLNFHPGANNHIEDYLENAGFEVVEARMTDVIRKTYFYKHAQSREFGVDMPLGEMVTNAVSDRFFDLAHNNCDRLAKRHPLFEAPVRLPDLVKPSDEIIHHTFDAGEGVLIPAEVLHHVERGCRAFVILQPFGCLPNHIVGRGIVKALKTRYPQARILALDYDPDVSFANVENRLQMLVQEFCPRS